MAYPDPEEYYRRARTERLIPVWEEGVVDWETPISIYQRVKGEASYSYLLESVEGGEQVARYSFIGLDPLLVMRTKGQALELLEDGVKIITGGNPLEHIRDLLASYRVGDHPGLPRFYGGAVGYFAYDFVYRLEKLPRLTADDLDLPDCYLVITEVVLIYDHVQRVLKTVVLTQPGQDPSASYQKALAKLAVIRERLGKPMADEASGRFRPLSGQTAIDEDTLNCNIKREDFLNSVRKAQEYIRAGDIFQVVLSRRWAKPFDQDPFLVYRALRVLNPSPYMFYLNFKGVQLVGSSPEMLVRVEDGCIHNRPIAGTRPRGRTPGEDEALAHELIQDAKELAEHLMLVDLGRNDVGKVADYGTVEVPRFMQIERYSHVMHIVSWIQGHLAEGKHAGHALAACFPAGTVSGAPKVRAMEIIEELEPTRRGPYAGAVGYLSFNGNLDSCITIRTAIFRGKTAYIQAGAGIVADSVPEAEYVETWNKAKALFAALALVEEGSR